MGCFEDFFGIDEQRLRVRPVDPNVAPKELVRLAQSRLHHGYIGHSVAADGDTFYSSVRPGRLAADLSPIEKGLDDGDDNSVEPRVQQLFAERLREILRNVGIVDVDLTAWESKPPKRKTRAEETVRLKVFELGAPEDIPAVVADIRQRHAAGDLRDLALLKEVLRLAVSVQDAGLSNAIGRPLVRHLLQDVRNSKTGFFSEMFVQSLESIAAKHCAEGWPTEQRARSNARRDVVQFLASHRLDDDRVWQMLCMEYLRKIVAA
jgi:hypothetical protein